LQFVVVVKLRANIDNLKQKNIFILQLMIKLQMIDFSNPEKQPLIVSNQ